MSLATVAFLAARIRVAEVKWDKAMRRPGYRDDPEDPEDPAPFTEQEQIMWGWADSWRRVVHVLEDELDSLPEASYERAQRYGLVQQEPVYVEQTHTIEVLSKVVK